MNSVDIILILNKFNLYINLINFKLYDDYLFRYEVNDKL